MKRITYSRIAIISEKDATAFEASINSRLDELADCKPELIMESVKDRTAYIRYKVDEIIPESLTDRCELMGIKYHCWDCLYCKLKSNKDGTIDRRAKKAYCEQGKKYTLANSPACDTFYFELISGTGQFSRGGGAVEDLRMTLDSENRQKLLTSNEFEIAADHHADR